MKDSGEGKGNVVSFLNDLDKLWQLAYDLVRKYPKQATQQELTDCIESVFSGIKEEE